jgi:transposase
MNTLYGGIDLHSNNNVLVLSDEEDKEVYRKRLRNDLSVVLNALAPFSEQVEGLVVESTYNWYWLVDGLQEAGYQVHLANTAAIQQYSGLKYGDDNSDSRWLAQMLRLGVLPEGYIYPKEERAVRDVLRKRSHLVRQRTSNILSIQNIVTRNTASSLKANLIKKISDSEIDELLSLEEAALAVKSSLAVIRCLKEQIRTLERHILARVKLRDEYQGLLTVPGIGQALALTIMLETGDIARFDEVGNYASYARCVGSTRISNNKRKGSGNRKNGNKYLAWAFVEAANFSIRFEPRINSYYQKKASKTKAVVAKKAVAHKLARACYHILRDGTSFDVGKAFG